MKKIEEIKQALGKHKKEINRKFKVKNIGIFGSYLRDEQKKKSDIDILVEFKEPIGLFEFMDLEEYLQTLLGAKVDVVSKKALKPRIGEYILREVMYI